MGALLSVGKCTRKELFKEINGGGLTSNNTMLMDLQLKPRSHILIKSFNACIFVVWLGK